MKTKAEELGKKLEEIKEEEAKNNKVKEKESPPPKNGEKNKEEKSFFKNFLEKLKKLLTPKNWEDKVRPVVKTVKVDGKWKEEQIIGSDGKPKTEVAQEGRKRGFCKRFGYFFTGMSVMMAIFFFADIFVGKILFKITLSVVVAFVIGKRQKKWRWRILTFLAIFFINMLYVGESIELLRSAVLLTVCGATIFFFAEERFSGIDVYPKGMLPFFLVVFFVCFLWALSDLFQDHEYYVQKQRSSVSNLQKEIDTKKEITERFSLSELKIEVPETSFSVKVLEGEKKPISQLARDWLPVKIENCLPAEYGRVNSFIRKILFIIFFLVVNLCFAPIATFELLKELIESKMNKGDKKGKQLAQQTDLFSFYGMIQAAQDLAGSFKKKGGGK